jgi:hypothetical protein
MVLFINPWPFKLPGVEMGIFLLDTVCAGYIGGPFNRHPQNLFQTEVSHAQKVREPLHYLQLAIL